MPRSRAAAWQGSTRRSRLPHDWATRRVRVLRRDGYKCQARNAMGTPCLAPAGEVDHITPGDDHDLENLQAMCKRCHARKSSAEGNAARPKRLRVPEAHPGLLG